ncbi:alpha/beta fold hydrolase [Flavobacterium sp.]|uniref:alpha/beta fold hydrolase n=1 Tax=Flavobacterium sp. TaxID=239 RepID=UPI0037506D9E
MENNQTLTSPQKNDSILELNHEKYIQTAPNVKIHFKDYGQGKPVILIHGWPLSNEMWEYQIENLVANNFRVIAYDRRGFGKSSQPWNGYDYDTLTDDLQQIIEQLKLENATLVGFSMGGGEAVRYLSRHSGKGVSKIILVASVTPFQLKTEDNPDGKPAENGAKTAEAIKNDRIGFLDEFGKNFFGITLISKPLSTPLLEYYRMLCSFASPHASLECAKSFSTTDFRKEMSNINIPTLIIHGDNDKIVPIEISGEKSAKLIRNSKFIVYEDAPHGLFYTHKERLNADLVEFINS